MYNAENNVIIIDIFNVREFRIDKLDIRAARDSLIL